jgi:hypothetical protein
MVDLRFALAKTKYIYIGFESPGGIESAALNFPIRFEGVHFVH